VLLEDAQRIVGLWVNHDNTVRLHSAIGYITPLDKMEGRETQIFAERDPKLEQARLKRQQRRQEKQQAAAGLQEAARVNGPRQVKRRPALLRSNRAKE